MKILELSGAEFYEICIKRLLTAEPMGEEDLIKAIQKCREMQLHGVLIELVLENKLAMRWDADKGALYFDNRKEVTGTDTK